MSELSAGLRARAALEKRGFQTTHSLGQNFILDDGVISRLLDSAEIAPDDDVLEIGPGAGVMSRHLAERCRSLLSVELDERLQPVLEFVLEGVDNASVVFQDALKCDLSALTRAHFPGKYRVVANLPYYITSDMIEKILKSGEPVTSLTLMVQKEAAERIMSRPGTKSWCALAALVRYFAEPEILEEVPRDTFEPAPHVDSAFIRLSIYEEKPCAARNEAVMLRLISAAFAMRRKTLANNLKMAFGMNQETAADVLTRAGLDPKVRGEALEIDEMVRLADVIAGI